MMIGIIVINYHSEEKTISFVKDCLGGISSEYAVVIVDNGSTEESRTALLEAFKGSTDQYVFVVPSEENLGFAKGNNLGAAVAVNQFSPSLLLFANNDIRLEGGGVVERMADKLQATPDAALIGPRVVGLDGRLQSPEPYMSFWRRHVWHYWSNLIPPLGRRERTFVEGYSSKAAEGFHYRVSGAFFMVRTSDWQAVGGMDPNTFLYAEEMILSERLKKVGRKVYYYPEVTVVHEHGATTGKYYDELKVRSLKFESESYYYRTYMHTPSWQFAAARFTYSLKRLFKR